MFCCCYQLSGNGTWSLWKCSQPQPNGKTQAQGIKGHSKWEKRCCNCPQTSNIHNGPSSMTQNSPTQREAPRLAGLWWAPLLPLSPVSQSTPDFNTCKSETATFPKSSPSHASWKQSEQDSPTMAWSDTYQRFRLVISFLCVPSPRYWAIQVTPKQQPVWARVLALSYPQCWYTSPAGLDFGLRC